LPLARKTVLGDDAVEFGILHRIETDAAPIERPTGFYTAEHANQ
jgi:hypothetical protein